MKSKQKSNFKFLLGVIIGITLLEAERVEIPSKDFISNPLKEIIEPQKEIVVYQKEPVEESTKESVTDVKIEQTSSDNSNFILKIGTVPKNATVKLINTKINYKWAMKLPKDHYEILVQKKGYHDQELNITLNQDTYKKVQLRRKTHTLTITPNIKGATVKILNIYPKYRDNIRLNANVRYSIAVSKKGYHDKYFTLDPLTKDRKLNVKLNKKKMTSKSYTLWVRPIYKGKYVKAKIQILNLPKSIKYRKKIRLKQGYYDILVTYRGCQRRFYTNLKSNETIPVKMCK